jgi:osmotically inducible lipoprotein OsmB
LAFGGVGAIPGALIGAGIGGATGAVTNKDQVYLGQAIWDNRSNQGG